MTQREAAIVSAHTGILLGNFSALHDYVEGIMDRAVYTHEMGNKLIMEEIKEKSKPDFVALEIVTKQ